jgi:hypothetical protein
MSSLHVCTHTLKIVKINGTCDIIFFAIHYIFTKSMRFVFSFFFL